MHDVYVCVYTQLEIFYLEEESFRIGAKRTQLWVKIPEEGKQTKGETKTNQ